VGGLAAGAIVVAVGGDLYSVDRRFVEYLPPTSQLFAEDSITSYLASQPKPYRVFDAPVESGYQIGSVYPGDFLMALGIPTIFGYHGNEEFIYDQLWGGKNVYQNMVSSNLWDLWDAEFAIFGGELEVPGYHKVMGPVPTTPGGTGVLYQRDTPSHYARVVPAAVKLPEDQLISTVLDPKFPLNTVVLLADSAPVSPAKLGNQLPDPTPVTARVTAWAPGAMTIALDSTDARPTWLVVAETYFPDWQATVDGVSVPVLRGNSAQITVQLPAGARQVSLTFAGKGYGAGKVVSLLGVIVALVAIGLPALRRSPATT
jgi:hypothetical protein